MKSQLILVGLICLVTFSCVLASNQDRRSKKHHKRARKWAEKDNCVCSSQVCPKDKFDLTVGRVDGAGDSNNCACPKAKACTCEAGATAGVLEDQATACACLATCQKSAGGKALEAVKQVGAGIADLGKAGVDAAKSALSSTGAAVKGAAVATANAVQNAVDFCQCSKADFSGVAANSDAPAHKVASTMAIKKTPCQCVEDCNCPQLTILKRRFNKLNKLHQTTKAQRLIDSLRAAYNGTFKNGDKCTCDKNMVNKAKAAMASTVAGAKQLAGKAVDGAKALVAGAKQAISNVANGAKAFANKAGAAVSNAAASVGNAISSGIGAIGEALAGECKAEPSAYQANPQDPTAPWIAQGKQSRSKGLCEVKEKCVCESGKQKTLEVNSVYTYSKLPCKCVIGSVQLAANKAQSFLGFGTRLSKRQFAVVRQYCSSLNQEQCLNESRGCKFNLHKQVCGANKRLQRLQRVSKKHKLNRNINRFRQVPLNH